jgi:hypothetical protein
MTRTIDHIVYAVPELEAACDHIGQALGLRPVFGGYHRQRGTKNALLNLGEGAYLEVIAIDHANEAVAAPRWMGVDLIATPQVTRWAIKSDQLRVDQAALQSYHPEMGEIAGGERKTASGALLAWEMILPLAAPAVEVVPFMVDWSRSAAHPCDALIDSCRLEALSLSHPDPASLEAVFSALGIEREVEKGPTAGIQVSLKGPGGRLIL